MIRDLQARLQLKPDGIIGRKTFGAFRMHFNITPIQLAHFLGQCEHESGGWKSFEENMRYSAAALLRTWPSRYTEELAKKHEYKPSVIANYVYGGRMGNTEPNDGWTFRGRGAIQLTGRSNYQAFAGYIGDPSILTNPHQVATRYALESAKWYFTHRYLWNYTKDLSIESITLLSKIINQGNIQAPGDPHGLKDRIKKTLSYQKFIS